MSKDNSMEKAWQGKNGHTHHFTEDDEERERINVNCYVLEASKANHQYYKIPSKLMQIA